MTVVVSVPHSGTQALLRHLRALSVEPERSEGPAHIFHFGQHDAEIQACIFPLHVPVRNPIDTMISWLNRDKSLDALFLAMEVMSEHVIQLTTWHKIEDLPVVGDPTPDIRVYDRTDLARTFRTNVSKAVRDQYQALGAYGV